MVVGERHNYVIEDIQRDGERDGVVFIRFVYRLIQ